MQHLDRLIPRVTKDDAFTATMIEAGEGVLVGHRSRQPQCILARSRCRPRRFGRALMIGVTGHPDATKCRAEHGRMQRDYRLHATGLVVGDHQFLMPGEVRPGPR